MKTNASRVIVRVVLHARILLEVINVLVAEDILIRIRNVSISTSVHQKVIHVPVMKNAQTPLAVTTVLANQACS